MEAINLLIRLRARHSAVAEAPTQNDWEAAVNDRDGLLGEIDHILAIPESPGEQAIREGDEMVEECLRMNF